MDETERLIAVAALASPGEAIDAWNEWRATVPIESATTLLTWAAGYIHRNLLSAGVDDPYLRGIYRHNVITNGMRMVAAISAIRDLSSRWQITPLKSFGMTGDRYSRGLRPLADFDFYVTRAQASSVKSRLEELGFVALMNVSNQEFSSRVLRQRGSWNFTSATGVDLDLHWRLLEHLGTAASEKLVVANSEAVDSEFGPIRRLNDELMLICIGVHYKLLGTDLMSGFFDFAHLLKHVDVEKAARLAKETESALEIAQLCDELVEIVGVGARPELDRFRSALADVLVEAAPPIGEEEVSRMFERTPSRYFEPEYLKSPTLYRIWFALGRRAPFERFLLRLAGPFTRTRVDASAGPPSVEGVLGIGWHYRYPADSHRWANIPDARVVFRGRRDARRVRVVLDPHAWRVAPVVKFAVFANGLFLGYCDKASSEFEFALPTGAFSDTIEFSLRQTDLRRFVHPGIQVKWYRMLAPVTSIELLSEVQA